MHRRPGTPDPSRYNCRRLTLKTLIEIAYGVTPPDVSGPSWIETELYEIVPKPPEGATQEQMPAMLRTLLEERFALRIRRYPRARPVYAMLAPHGSGKLKSSLASNEPEDPAAAMARGRAAGQRRRAWGPVSVTHIDDPRMSMQDLASVLSSRLDRAVQDLTGIDGTYAIELDFVNDRLASDASPTPTGAADERRPPTVVEALQELGLRLELRKASVEMLIVEDAAKKPRENE